MTAEKQRPEKAGTPAKNRAWGKNGERVKFAYKIPPQALGLQQGIGPRVTETVSGRPRWLSRDPLGEDGGLNLYAMVGNDPVNSWDYLGLYKDVSKANDDLVKKILCRSKNITFQNKRAVRLQAESRMFGILVKWTSLISTASYASSGTNNAYMFMGSYLARMVEDDLLSEDEVVEIIKKANIATDARAQLAKMREAIAHLNKEIPEDKIPHRGRFQAQSKSIDESQKWAQIFPLNKKQGQLLLNALWKELGSKTQEFGGGIKAARALVKNAPAAGITVGAGQSSIGISYESRYYS